MNMDSGEIYLRWVKNELNSQEVERLRQSGDLAILEAIKQETDTWYLPLSSEGYAKLMLRLSERRKRRTKVVSLFNKLRVAAAILLFTSLSTLVYFVFLRTIEFQSIAGQTQTFVLPDNSIVTLQGESKLAYNPYNWEKNRVVEMDGVVLFDIRKKGDFKVKFNDGEVNVKGTVFEVQANQRVTTVRCYEGKVAVNFKEKSFILLPGNGVKSTNETFNFKVELISNESYTYFNNAPLTDVLIALSNKFGYEFDMKLNLNEKYFTGRFDNNDGEKALKTVFNALSISYEISGDQVRIK